MIYWAGSNVRTTHNRIIYLGSSIIYFIQMWVCFTSNLCSDFILVLLWPALRYLWPAKRWRHCSFLIHRSNIDLLINKCNKGIRRYFKHNLKCSIETINNQNWISLSMWMEDKWVISVSTLCVWLLMPCNEIITTRLISLSKTLSSYIVRTKIL